MRKVLNLAFMQLFEATGFSWHTFTYFIIEIRSNLCVSQVFVVQTWLLAQFSLFNIKRLDTFCKNKINVPPTKKG